MVPRFSLNDDVCAGLSLIPRMWMKTVSVAGYDWLSETSNLKTPKEDFSVLISACGWHLSPLIVERVVYPSEISLPFASVMLPSDGSGSSVMEYVSGNDVNLGISMPSSLSSVPS